RSPGRDDHDLGTAGRGGAGRREAAPPVALARAWRDAGFAALAARQVPAADGAPLRDRAPALARPGRPDPAPRPHARAPGAVVPVDGRALPALVRQPVAAQTAAQRAALAAVPRRWPSGHADRPRVRAAGLGADLRRRASGAGRRAGAPLAAGRPDRA